MRGARFEQRPRGDISPQRCGRLIRGDRESYPGGARCLKGAYGGSQPPAAQALWLGQTGSPAQGVVAAQRAPRAACKPPMARPIGRGVLPGRRLLPEEHLWGIAATNGAGPLAGGMGGPTKEVDPA